MTCDIVKNWVGTMDNTFFVCRTHKVECPNDHNCPSLSSKDPAVGTESIYDPWCKDLDPGDVILDITNAPDSFQVRTVDFHLRQVHLSRMYGFTLGPIFIVKFEDIERLYKPPKNRKITRRQVTPKTGWAGLVVAGMIISLKTPGWGTFQVLNVDIVNKIMKCKSSITGTNYDIPFDEVERDFNAP